MSAEVFILFSIQKEIRQDCPLLFLKRNNNKNFSWYLVFSHWFLVNGLSNGKDTYLGNIISWILFNPSTIKNKSKHLRLVFKSGLYSRQKKPKQDDPKNLIQCKNAPALRVSFCNFVSFERSVMDGAKRGGEDNKNYDLLTATRCKICN